MYDADVSASLVPRVTDAVIDQVTEWQARPLDDVYPIAYLDCIVVKIRQDKRVINKAVYLALGVKHQPRLDVSGTDLVTMMDSREETFAETRGRKRTISRRLTSMYPGRLVE
jgi:transposase-like protein